MNAVDRYLQRQRIAKAAPWIPPGSRVLDIGCADGALFRQLAGRYRDSVGIDSNLAEELVGDGFELVQGSFTDLPAQRQTFDVITMLAVLEHVPEDQQDELAQACSVHLAPGGHLVITAPDPLVDPILRVLSFLHLIDGMELEQHYGFEASNTPKIFEPHGFDLVEARSFQLGLNHLFVFRRGGT